MLPPIPTSSKRSSPSVPLIEILISPMHATYICPHDHAPLCDHPNSGLWRGQIMKCPGWLCSPPSFLLNGYMGLLLCGWSGWGTKLTTHSHLVPWPGMHKAIPPLPHMPLRCRQVQFYWYLIKEFSPTSCYLIPAKFKYPPQHPILILPQSMFQSSQERPRLTPT
jgi:hypothetical protein